MRIAPRFGAGVGAREVFRESRLERVQSRQVAPATRRGLPRIIVATKVRRWRSGGSASPKEPFLWEKSRFFGCGIPWHGGCVRGGHYERHREPNCGFERRIDPFG